MTQIYKNRNSQVALEDNDFLDFSKQIPIKLMIYSKQREITANDKIKVAHQKLMKERLIINHRKNEPFSR